VSIEVSRVVCLSNIYSSYYLPGKFVLLTDVSPALYMANLLGAFASARVEYLTWMVQYIRRRRRRHRPTRIILDQPELFQLTRSGQCDGTYTKVALSSCPR
jgi:hypothetical protein